MEVTGNGKPGREVSGGKMVMDRSRERAGEDERPPGSERGTARKRTGNGCEASRNGRKRRSWTGSGQETDEKCNFKQYEP